MNLKLSDEEAMATSEEARTRYRIGRCSATFPINTGQASYALELNAYNDGQQLAEARAIADAATAKAAWGIVEWMDIWLDPDRTEFQIPDMWLDEVLEAAGIQKPDSTSE